ncbi:MAG: NfeD family protein [Clostridia bacterium]|nr:NfeD family protein [Clostridia bacterium]
MPYFWIVVMVAAVAIEVATPGALVAIWFLPSALVSMILAFLKVPLYVQIPVFIVLSLACVFFARPWLVRPGKNTATNIDAIIGEKGIVIEKIENIAGAGQVKVHGQYWSARSVADDCEYEEGDIVEIVAVEGVKLICKK